MTYRRLLLFFAACLIAPAGCAKPSRPTAVVEPAPVSVIASRPLLPPPDFRVMTWNLRLPSREDDAKNRGWEHRKGLLVQLIREQQPDILGVQELLEKKPSSPAEWLRTALTSKGAPIQYLVVQGPPGHPEDIYLRADRFMVLFPSAATDEPGAVRFGGCPESPGAADCPARLTSGFYLPPDVRTPCDSPITGTTEEGLRRSATFAIVRDRNTGRDFAVFNTHLHHKHETAADDLVRHEEVRCIRRAMARFAGGLPVIIMGDLNARSDAPELMALRDGFDAGDAPLSFTHPEGPPLGTYNNFCDDCVPQARIDHILVAGFDVVASGRPLYDRPDGRWPSDHCPVIVRLAPGDKPLPDIR